jgi:hypothetical protein
MRVAIGLVLVGVWVLGSCAAGPPRAVGKLEQHVIPFSSGFQTVGLSEFTLITDNLERDGRRPRR